MYQHCMRQALCASATVLCTLLKSTVLAVCHVHCVWSRTAPQTFKAALSCSGRTCRLACLHGEGQAYIAHLCALLPLHRLLPDFAHACTHDTAMQGCKRLDAMAIH